MVMPSEEYNRLTDADLAAVVAYIRQLPPKAGEGATIRLPMPVSALYAAGVVQGRGREDRPSLPPAQPVAEGMTAAHGAYVANGCIGCHGADLSGGKIAGAPPDWPAAARLAPGEGSVMGRYPDAAAVHRDAEDRQAPRRQRGQRGDAVRLAAGDERRRRARALPAPDDDEGAALRRGPGRLADPARRLAFHLRPRQRSWQPVAKRRGRCGTRRRSAASSAASLPAPQSMPWVQRFEALSSTRGAGASACGRGGELAQIGHFRRRAVVAVPGAGVGALQGVSCSRIAALAVGTAQEAGSAAGSPARCAAGVSSSVPGGALRRMCVRGKPGSAPRPARRRGERAREQDGVHAASVPNDRPAAG